MPHASEWCGSAPPCIYSPKFYSSNHRASPSVISAADETDCALLGDEDACNATKESRREIPAPSPPARSVRLVPRARLREREFCAGSHFATVANDHAIEEITGRGGTEQSADSSRATRLGGSAADSVASLNAARSAIHGAASQCGESTAFRGLHE